MIKLLNEDCMIVMARYPDNHFQLAITDPPYGIGESGGKDRRGKSKHIKKDWDSITPGIDYFNQLKRVSLNQIIWGANYFPEMLKTSMGWVCWDKKLDNSDFSDFELAYTSFNRGAKIFRYSKIGGSRTPAALADYIHPTQKPVQLYKWLLSNYAKEGDKILDTHGGSMSSAIACHDMDFDMVLCELDKDYFESGLARYKQHIKQLKLF